MSNSALGNAVTSTLGFVFVVAAVVAFLKRERRIAQYLLIAAYVLLFPIRLWFAQFGLTERGPASSVNPWYIFYGPVVQIVLFGIVPLIVSCFRPFRPVLTAFFLVYLFSLILQFFSYLYWVYGTTENFSIRLTHFDSFYFALGTLTTAGTGNISAISETARGLQTLQMALDLLFIGFAVTLVVARYSNLLSRLPVELPGDDAVKPGSRQVPTAAIKPRMRTCQTSTDPIIRQMSARRRRRWLRGR